MMLPFERKERYYNGNDTYKYIEKLLRRGKDIYIISPYIDKYYAGRIRAYSSRKKFHIISSSIEKEALDILGKQRSPMDLVIPLTLLFGMDSILYYIGFFSTYAAAISAILMAILFVGFYGSEKNNVSVLRPKDFVHAKIYLSENIAIEGSANLTYRGTHSNIEHITITLDPDKVGAMREDFWKMWDSFS